MPARAVTLTIPALLSAAELFCMVPGARKKRAVTDALRGPVTGLVPASALRTHPRCRIYLDKESAPDASDEASARFRDRVRNPAHIRPASIAELRRWGDLVGMVTLSPHDDAAARVTRSPSGTSRRRLRRRR